MFHLQAAPVKRPPRVTGVLRATAPFEKMATTKNRALQRAIVYIRAAVRHKIWNCMVHKVHKPHLKTAQDARAVRSREAMRNALLRLLELKPLDDIIVRD